MLGSSGGQPGSLTQLAYLTRMPSVMIVWPNLEQAAEESRGLAMPVDTFCTYLSALEPIFLRDA